MNKNKKWRCISMMSMTGVATVIPIFSIGCSRGATYQVAAENKLVPLTNEEIVQLMHKDIAIDQNLIGMEYNPTKYDELVKARTNYTKSETEDYITFENDDLIINFEKELIRKRSISDEFMSSVVKMIFEKTDASILTAFQKLWWSKKLSFNFIQHKNYPNAMAVTIPSDDKGIEIEMFLLDSQWIHFMESPSEELLKYIGGVITHEMGHFQQYTPVDSRDGVDYLIFTDGRSVGWVEDYEEYKKYSYINHNDVNLFTQINSMNTLKRINELALSSGGGWAFEKLDNEYVDSIITNYYNNISGKSSKYLAWDTPLESQTFQSNIHDKIAVMINSLQVQATNSVNSGLLADMTFHDEVTTRIQSGYKDLYMPDFLKVASSDHKIEGSLGEQMRMYTYVDLNPYPNNVQFPKAWMAAWYKSFLGIGDMNTLLIDNKFKKIWFGASSTNISNIIGSIKLIYHDETIDLDIQNKEYPFGWHFQPIAFQQDYKYVSHSAYAFKTLKNDHLENKPQQIIFYDKTGREIKASNTQLLVFGNQKYRFTLNENNTWKENYDLFIKDVLL